MVRSALRDVGRRGGVEVVLVPLLRQVDHDRLEERHTRKNIVEVGKKY